MKSLKDSETANNLINAFRSKTYDQQRYMNYAAIAVEEGYIQIANLFKQIAKNDNEHARLIARFLICSGFPSDEICTLNQMPIHCGDTLTNLQIAARDEGFNAMNLYPEYTQKAYDEKYLEVAIMFHMIGNVDKNHGSQLANIASMLENNTFYNKKTIEKWICNRCGYVYTGYTPPDICPLCNASENYFEIQCIRD